MNVTYTDAVLFVRELRKRADAKQGADLSPEELAMVFMVIDDLVPIEEE